MHQHGGNIYKYQNLIDFSTNTNLAGMPESVKKAAHQAVELSSGYPDPKCTQLMKAISDYENMPIEYILSGNGAAELIFLVTQARRPRKALICGPTFYEYVKALRSVNCEVSYFLMKNEEEFILSDRILEEIQAGIEMVYLCNPNNPTGNLIKKELLIKILDQCEKKKILLFVDECFMDFVENGEEYSIKEKICQTGNVFILKAFTKTYAMPGLRLGYGMCSDLKLLEQMRELSQPWSISLPAQMAGIAALSESQYLQNSLRILEEEKVFLRIKLQELGLKVYGSKANFIFFYTQSECLFEKCMKHGLLIRDCRNFQGLSDGYYRIQVRGRRENELLIAALKEEV